MRPTGDAPVRSRPERRAPDASLRLRALRSSGPLRGLDVPGVLLATRVPTGRAHDPHAAPVGDDVSYLVDGMATHQWRCLNAPWGCNWMLPAAEGAIWCRSCRLTRGRPDAARPDAITAWSYAETAKAPPRPPARPPRAPGRHTDRRDAGSVAVRPRTPAGPARADWPPRRRRDVRSRRGRPRPPGGATPSTRRTVPHGARQPAP